MNVQEQNRIANSFPEKYETKSLDLEISIAEFKTVEGGVFSKSMEAKWNVFVLDSVMYFARSWSHFCIYKVHLKREVEKVIISSFQVNRDDNQYKNKDLDFDTIIVKKLLQNLLGREDFYSDPELELPLIKETIKKLDPNNEYKKSIGSNNVGLTRQIYNGLAEHQKMHVEICGWAELKEMIASKSESEPLISLYMHHRTTNSGSTYYFDKDATQLLGHVSKQIINLT